MPCSPSADRPSTSSAKSMSPPCVPHFFESFSIAASWSSNSIFDSYSSRPMTVDLPSSTEPQVMKRSRLFFSCCLRYFSMSVAIRSDWCAMSVPRMDVDGDGGVCPKKWQASEIALLLLLLHRGRGVVVDHPTL